MTLETFYFVAQIVAAFAVVASLVFVGLQVRENTKEQALRRSMERNATYIQSQSYLIENKDIREVWVKGANGLSPLSEEGQRSASHPTDAKENGGSSRD